VKTSEGAFYDAEIIIVDEKNDLAIIRIKNSNGKTFPMVKLGNSDNVKVGQDVFAIGSPFGYEYTISQGIVQASGITKSKLHRPCTLPIEKFRQSYTNYCRNITRQQRSIVQ
jgi:S1-C subfamily serine protease